MGYASGLVSWGRPGFQRDVEVSFLGVSLLFSLRRCCSFFWALSRRWKTPGKRLYFFPFWRLGISNKPVVVFSNALFWTAEVVGMDFFKGHVGLALRLGAGAGDMLGSRFDASFFFGFVCLLLALRCIALRFSWSPTYLPSS